MTAPYYVEVLARNGDVRQRLRLDALPIRLGRGYDNDVILDDRHTSPHHAEIDIATGGELVVRDLASRNGVIVDGQRRAEMAIYGHTVFRLGHTSLRVRAADFAVADELLDTTRHGWEGWPPALTGLLVMTVTSIAGVWISDTEKFAAVPYVTALAGLLTLGLVWCGLWAFANRLFGGHARFGRHVFILACGLMAMDVWEYGSAVIAYAMSLEVLSRYGNQIRILLVAGMVFFHLLTINPRQPKRFAVACGVLAVLGSALLLMTNYQRSGRLADELYLPELLPPVLRLSSDKSLDVFFNDAAKMKAILDVDRTKEVRGSGDVDESD